MKYTKEQIKSVNIECETCGNDGYLDGNSAFGYGVDNVDLPCPKCYSSRIKILENK